MLQDKYLKQAYIRKSEAIEINAPIDKVYPFIEKLDFHQSKIVFWLFKLRGLPVPEGLSLNGLEKINFVKLEVIRNEEIIMGIIGKFWTPTGRLIKFKPEEFKNYENKDFAKATWNFELIRIDDFRTRLNTETRVFCPTRKMRNTFWIYWTIIQPFSSLIRREILKAIKKQVENK